jgi:hypothetical protein
VRSIIIGLISFFVTKDHTVGSIRNATAEQQIEIAKNSRKKILENKKFIELFETFKPNIGIIDVPYNPEPESKVADDRQSAKIVPVEENKEAEVIANPPVALGNTEPLLTEKEKLHMDAPVIGNNKAAAAPNKKKCLLILLALVLVAIIVVLVVFWNKIFG